MDKDVIRKYEQQFEHPRVLAVDDGCNSVHTFNHMVSLLRAVGTVVEGYAVFLNALNEARRAEVRSAIGANFFCFYRWQLGPFTKGRCPVCTSRRAHVAQTDIAGQGLGND